MKTVIGPASNGKTYLSQGTITGALLLAMRQTEAQRGQLLAHHDRAEHALRPTNTRKSPSRSLARRSAKLAARYREAVAVWFQHETGKRWGDLTNQGQQARAELHV